MTQKPLFRSLLTLVLALVVIGVGAWLLLGRPLPGPAEPIPVPGTPTPVGWVKHETPRLILWLPAEWETLEVNRGDLRELFKEFQERNPELAGIIGSAEALEGVFLWAFDTQSGDPAANNLNVRRTELGGVTAADIPSIVAGAVGQYRQLGIEVQSFESDLEIGGRPAGHIAYILPVIGRDGQQIQAQGHQYLVAAGHDLWVLSYTIAPEQSARLTPIIQQSAASFVAK